VEALTRVREAESRVAEWTAEPDMKAALDYYNEIVATALPARNPGRGPSGTSGR
jgi:hypothetical protein